MAKWAVVSLDGLSLATTDYAGYFPTRIMSQGRRKPKYTKRGNNFSVLSAIDMPPSTLPLRIKILNDIETGRDALAQQFDLSNPKLEKIPLIIKDESDSDDQYTVEVVPTEFELDGTEIELSLAMDDWRFESVTTTTDEQTLVADGTSWALSVGGNIPTPPLIRITPTQARVSGGQVYRRFIEVTNPRTDRAYLNHPINLMDGEAGNGWATSDLMATSDSVQIDNVAGISADTDVIDFDTELGSFPSRGEAFVDTEQIRYTGKSATQLTGVERGVGGTTAATHADNALISSSKMMADGDDIEVFVDGVRRDRWLADINGQDTKVWVNLNLPAALTGTIGAAIASSDSPTEITFQGSAANLKFGYDIPESGMLKINSEYFVYTGKDIPAAQLTGVLRAQNGSAAANHAVADVATLIPHHIQVLYGGGQDESTNSPDADDFKPMINLSTSTNSSWVFAEFSTNTKKRSAEWVSGIYQIYPSGAATNEAVRTYSDSQDTFADPSTELGLRIKALNQGGTYAFTAASMSAKIYNPVGITTLTLADGEKYVDGSKWPTAVWQSSGNGKDWNDEFTETIPSATTTWEATTNAGGAMTGTYEFVRLLFEGGVDGGATQREAKIEVSDITLTLASANKPATTLQSENEDGGVAGALATYETKITLTNVTTSDAIYIQHAIPLNETLVIDCKNKRVYIEGTEQDVIGAMQLLGGIREAWLNLKPGSNVIRLADADGNGCTVAFEWNHRHN